MRFGWVGRGVSMLLGSRSGLERNAEGVVRRVNLGVGKTSTIGHFKEISGREGNKSDVAVFCTLRGES